MGWPLGPQQMRLGPKTLGLKISGPYNIYVKNNFCFNLVRDEIAQFLQKMGLNGDKSKNTWTKLRMRK